MIKFPDLLINFVCFIVIPSPSCTGFIIFCINKLNISDCKIKKMLIKYQSFTVFDLNFVLWSFSTHSICMLEIEKKDKRDCQWLDLRYQMNTEQMFQITTTEHYFKKMAAIEILVYYPVMLTYIGLTQVLVYKLLHCCWLFKITAINPFR